jgi:hypothetical protein
MSHPCPPLRSTKKALFQGVTKALFRPVALADDLQINKLLSSSTIVQNRPASKSNAIRAPKVPEKTETGVREKRNPHSAQWT